MKSHFFAMLSRMKNINRWGLMRNVRNENLCEHSFETAVIAHALAEIANNRLGAELDADKIAVCALFHDTTEILTGDMPTPVKYYNDDIKKAYKQVEKTAQDKLLSLLPDYLKNSYSKVYETDSLTESYVKAADKLSALIKCIEELSMGNKEFESAKKSTEKSIKELNLEAADIFLKEFIPSYSLTLDEQNNLEDGIQDKNKRAPR